MKPEKLPGTIQLAYFIVGRVQWTKMKRETAEDHVISIFSSRMCPIKYNETIETSGDHVISIY